MKFLCFFIFILSCFGNIEDRYQNVFKTAPSHPLRRVDYAYVINLDQRPERWQICKNQMDLYGLTFQRFSAIYGWDLTPEQLRDVGLVFQQNMWDANAPLIHFPTEKDGQPIWLKQSKIPYGQTVFFGWLTKGTIGRTLSHLSVLKDALDAGYETVWVMEDEFLFLQDPHILDSYLEILDESVGYDIPK